MRALSFFIFAVSALGLSAPSVAQEQNSKRDDPIIVKGDREETEREARRQARDIIVDRNLRRQPLARFEKPICPGVIGLPKDLALPLIERIRAIANTVGVRAADGTKCAPNLIVAFSGDGKADLAEMAERESSILDSLPFSERKALLAEEGPARAFSVVVTKSNSGMPLMGNPPSVQVTMASRLMLTIRRDIETSVVVIDADAADGLSIVQLADYSAMRTFARTRPPKSPGPLGTILNLFDERNPLDQISAFDLAFLESVYSGASARAGMSKIQKVGQNFGMLPPPPEPEKSAE